MEKLANCCARTQPAFCGARRAVGLIATWERRPGGRARILPRRLERQPSFDTDRIGRGHISIANLCVSIFGGIQPDKLTVIWSGDPRLPTTACCSASSCSSIDPRRWEWRDCAPNKAGTGCGLRSVRDASRFDPATWWRRPATSPSSQLLLRPAGTGRVHRMVRLHRNA